MKKIVCILLILIFTLSIAACDTSPAETTAENTTSAEETTTTVEETTTTAEETTTTVEETTTTIEETTTTIEENTTTIEENTTTVEETTTTVEETTTTVEETTTTIEETTTTAEETTTDGTVNEKVDLTAYLTALLNGYKAHPFSAIPKTMLPSYQDNLIAPDSVISDYSNFVQVSDINKSGIGQQWSMVMDNLQQSELFFNTLSVIDGLTTTSIVGFNNYIDRNPDAEAQYEFESGIYSVNISCNESSIFYVVEYLLMLPKEQVEEQEQEQGQKQTKNGDMVEIKVQIALSMDLETQEKTVRVQVGDANAMVYTVSENGITMAIKYLGIRRAYLDIRKDEAGTYLGHIYEYFMGIPSVADFYINSDYVTVVGNKADGMLLTENYICELYSVNTGRMLAYEVRESSDTIVSVAFNTLWFDLEDIDGIDSIRYMPKTEETESDQFFINGSSDVWETKSVGLLNPSRRFDIEFRTQYFYYYDAENEVYVKVSAQVPMLFVQEEYLDDLPDDVKSKNDVKISVALEDKHVQKLMLEYAQKIDLLIQNKDKYTVEMILNYIGSPISFE